MRKVIVREPEFSVIIPAYNVQGYLRQAALSAVDGDRAEVIIVDDRSTDGTSTLADELAETNTAIRVVRPESNVGLGFARNLGLEHARGEYVVFVDGDDYLVEGAFDVLHRAIGEHAPDLVIFGYKRLYPNGDAVEGVMREQLQVDVPFTADEYPEILDVLNVAWNKAYRREFLTKSGIHFPVGYYEDIPWTYPLVASASRIVAVDEPLYMYRQRWSGSILRSTDKRHVEIVDQFERLMDVMDTLDVSDFMRREVYTRGFRNLVTVATTKRRRVPKHLRRGYYLRARAAVRARRPAQYELPTSGIKWKLMHAIWTMGYRKFSLRLWASETRWKVRSSLRKVVRVGIRVLRSLYHHRWVYKAYRRFSRVDPNLVVLENLWGLSPRLNCLAIDAEIRRSHPELRLVWCVNRAAVPGVPQGIEYTVKYSHKYFKALARGKYFFLDVNLPDWWRKRSGQIFTQLHHGTPLKLMGVEERGQDRNWMNGLLARSRHWDYSVVSSPYGAEVWQHSYPVKCETLEYGYPRNDVLVNADVDASWAARQRLGVSDAARVFLYMPTFREQQRDSISAADINTVAQGLEPGDVLLTRGHYLAARTPGVNVHPAIIDVSNHATVEDLYLAADVLITDYSSAMFDFANLGRPIVIFAYDWDLYRHQRGTYFDITVDSPGAVVKTAAELAEVLSSRVYENDESNERLKRFAQIFCTFETGHAAADIVARVVDGKVREDLPRAAPPALTTWHMERMA